MPESTVTLSRSRKFKIRAGLRVWREDPQFASDVAAIDAALEPLTIAQLHEIIEESLPYEAVREIVDAMGENT